MPAGPSSNATPHSPAANADRSSVYVATTDYRLKKLRGADGAVVWDVDIGPVYDTAPWWNVAVSGDVVVVEKIDLFAYDTTTGAPRWMFAPMMDEPGYSAVAVDDSTVYSATFKGWLYAIDANTGVPRWSLDLSQGGAHVWALFPTYANDAVYVCTLDGEHGTFWAISAAAGTVKWSHPIQAEFPSQRSLCFGDAVTWHDLVIIPQSDGRVLAFRQNTGAIAWIAPRAHVLPSAAPSGSWNDDRWAAVHGDNLIVTSGVYPAKVVSLDPATGAERWRNTDIDAIPVGHPAVDDVSVYLSYGPMYAVYDVATGQRRWTNPSSEEGPETKLFGRPQIAADRIFIGGRDGVYALRK